MGKIIKYLTILIFMDLIFLLTGQAAVKTTGSFILGAILDPGSVESSLLYVAILAAVTFVGFAGGIATFTGSSPRNSVLFSGFAAGLLVLTLDFISIYIYLSSLGTAAAVLGLMIFGPLIALYVFSVIEWQKDRD